MQNWNDPASQSSRLVRLVLKTGIVQEPKQAEYVLVALGGFLVLLSLWMFIPDRERVDQNDVQQNPNYEPLSTR